MTIALDSTLTCPHCGTTKAEIMPTDACQYFYECTGCGTLLKPQPGDCCVFCSYGSVPCPPVQQDRATACCSTADPAASSADAGPWPFCSLDRDAFRERMAEIDALAIRFDGRPRRTDHGMELVFPARDGLRSALDALVDQERQCCGTLAWSVEVRGDALVLCIGGSGHERSDIHDLAARLGQRLGKP